MKSFVGLIFMSFFLLLPELVEADCHFFVKTKDQGHEIRIRRHKGQEVGHSLDFSSHYPHAEKMIVYGDNELNHFLKVCSNDFGLQKNSALKSIMIIHSNEFLNVLGKSKLNSLKKLSIICSKEGNIAWEFLSRYPHLKSLSVESAESLHLPHFLNEIIRCRKLERLEICFDDYISIFSAHFTKEEEKLLSYLTSLKELVIKIYRYLPNCSGSSEKKYFTNLRKNLQKKLSRTKVKVLVTEIQGD